MICGVLWTTSCTQHNVSAFHLCCSMYHDFIFYCQYSLIRVSCFLFIHPSADGHLRYSTFWLWWIMLLWTFPYMFFCGHVFLFVFISLGYIPGSGSAGSYGNFMASQVVLVERNSPANAGDIRDVGSIPGWWRSPEGGHGNPLQCSCLERPRDRGAWRAIVQEDHTESDMTEAT